MFRNSTRNLAPLLTVTLPTIALLTTPLLLTACGGPDDTGTHTAPLWSGGWLGSTLSAPTSVETLGSGKSWRYLSIAGSGTDIDDGTLKKAVDRRLYMVRGAIGIEDAPLPSALKADLLGDIQDDLDAKSIASDKDAVYFVDEATVEKVLAQASGSSIDGIGTRTYGLLGFGGCDSKTKTFSRSVGFSESVARAFNDPDGKFTGRIGVDAQVSGGLTAALHVKVKRTKLFGVCTPYAVGYAYVTLEGDASASATVDVDAQFTTKRAWKAELANPTVEEYLMWVGPVPVVIGFSVPVHVGINTNGAAQMSFAARATAGASFEGYCDLSKCEANRRSERSFQITRSPSASGPDGAVIKPWVQAAARVYLYSKSKIYGQIGVQPFVKAEVHSQTGSCGDGDGDGVDEPLTLTNVDGTFGADLTAEVRVFGYSDSFKLAQLFELHAFSYTPTGSESFAPIFYQYTIADNTLTAATDEDTGGSEVTATTETFRFRGRLRPCWPYTDDIEWRLAWGDGFSEMFVGNPRDLITATHAFVKGRTYHPTLTAVRDARGRELGFSTQLELVVGGTAFGDMLPPMDATPSL